MGRVFRFDRFEFDRDEGRLSSGGVPVDLQPKVADALALLLDRAGTLIRKRVFLDVLWPDEAVQEGSLNQVVRKLRSALGDDQRQPRFIETVHRRGYRFISPVVAAEAGVAPAPAAPLLGEAAGSPAGADRAGSEPRRGWWRAAAAAAAALAVVGLTAAVLWPSRRTDLPRLEPGLVQLRRLTFTAARELEGDLSRDGRSYVYSAIDAGTGSFDLFLGRIAGGQAARLTATPEDEHAPRLSPDGERIAFCRTLPDRIRSSLLTMAVLGGEERLVAEQAEAPAWSPDGRELAYAVAVQDGSWKVIASKLASGARRTLVPAVDEIASLAWSPDGDQLAFAAENALWIAPARGGPPRRVGPDAEYIRQVAWHPSQRSLICDANWGGRANLWSVPIDGGPVRPITAGSGGTYHPSVSAAGLVLYTQEQQLRRLVLVDDDGRGPRPLDLPGVAHCPDVAAASGQVAFRNIDAGLNAESIVVAAPAGDSHVLAGPDEGGFGCPSFSPDGRLVAFAAGTRRDRLSLCRSDGAGCVELALPAGTRGAGAPAWSPDATSIAVPASGAGAAETVLLLDARTGAAAGAPIAALRSPSWSPDGRFIAGIAADPGGEVELVELAGGGRRRLAGIRSFTAPPVWSAAGATMTVLVDERRRPALLDVDLQGNVVRSRVLEIPPDPGLWGVFDARPAPQGWLLLSVRYEGDLYLAEPRPQAD